MNKLKIIKYILISFLIAIIILVMLIYIYEKDLFNAYRLLNENKIDVIPEENKKIKKKTKKCLNLRNCMIYSRIYTKKTRSAT